MAGEPPVYEIPECLWELLEIDARLSNRGYSISYIPMSHKCSKESLQEIGKSVESILNEFKLFQNSQIDSSDVSDKEVNNTACNLYQFNIIRSYL